MEETEIKKSSNEWAKIYEEIHGLRILDPDGWDRSLTSEKWKKEWEKPITEIEFRNKLVYSTLEGCNKLSE